MKQNKHEPGPWVLGGCSGRMITTPSGYVGNGFIADVDTLANAKLIAAAPDLLKELQRLRDYVINICGVDDGDCDAEHPLMSSMAAISKALGEE
ncbi:TPA: hypothetical protein I4D22_15970 [Enterobacter asburiae]|nr:hypothetical protein [Enterobacter asburiae]HAS1419350.1 hypothetical protein [Enterobacter asburiae]